MQTEDITHLFAMNNVDVNILYTLSYKVVKYSKSYKSRPYYTFILWTIWLGEKAFNLYSLLCLEYNLLNPADKPSISALIFPGSPAERRSGLVGLSSSWGSAVLAAGSLLRADLPWCHTRGGQPDDTLGKWWDVLGTVDIFRNMLVNKMCLVGRHMKWSWLVRWSWQAGWTQGWDHFLDTRRGVCSVTSMQWVHLNNYSHWKQLDFC